MFKRSLYGTLPNGEPVYALTLSHKNEIAVTVITYGATMTSLLTHGKDVVLGYNSLAEYLEDTASIGVTVGRYANRIAGGTFELNGFTYDIGRNETARNGHLHGGSIGFQHKNWRLETHDDKSFTLSLVSPDGDMGYPGTLNLKLRVALDTPSALSLTYTAVCDKDTVVNFTNHAYFNLNGYDGSDILNTELFINADEILAVNDRLIPTGARIRVDGTPFDFRVAKPIGRDINNDHEQLKIGGGYDHNFILGDTMAYRHAVTAYSPSSGIRMQCHTDQPGIQLYTANFLDSACGKGGAMTKHQGFCLETQHFPDSPHHPDFPTTVLRAGEIFESRTVYSFE